MPVHAPSPSPARGRGSINGHGDAADTQAPPDYARPFAGARWIDVLPRTAACPGVPAQVLLHAGPAYRGTPPAPVLHAAIQALLFEGAAADERAAARLLGEGAVHLEPAQDHGIVTPLAQVVSASMPLLAVEQRGEVCFAPLVEGPPPALRFGSLLPSCRTALRDSGAWAASALAPLVRRQPPPIDAIIRAAVAAGDECHARTGAAGAALAAQLAGLAAADAERLRLHAAFVLPLLMAAAAAALRTHGCALTGLGGNGLDYGLRWRPRAGAAARWTCAPALAPQGVRLAGHAASSALGAIGDSAVIDLCGLGGQALAAAPLLVAEWHDTLPADALARRARLIDPRTGIVDPQRVLALDLAPLVNLAILERSGACGLIGRGVYAVPPGLFAAPPDAAAGASN
jgi:hypothetical protein